METIVTIKHNMTEDEFARNRHKEKEFSQEVTYNTIDSVPWIDSRIPPEAMNHLWKCIRSSDDNEDAKGTLAGNISRSEYIKDKDDLFFKNVLKGTSEFLHLRDSGWINYFEVVIGKRVPPPIFELQTLWVNYQKQHEFNPPHCHNGLYSFVVFMKIPTHWKEQHALPISTNSNTPCASDFQFLYGEKNNKNQMHNIPLCPEDEGRILFFPAWLSHQVFPFYECEEERITISGNISIVSQQEKNDQV